jgi:hypothetical protein
MPETIAPAKIESRLCKYVFNDREKREIAVDLADGVAKVASLEDQKKAMASQMKSEIEGAQARNNGNAEKLRSGYEMRSLDCEKVTHFDTRTVRWYRIDNAEMVHERPMRPEELQKKLPGVEVPDASA